MRAIDILLAVNDEDSFRSGRMSIGVGCSEREMMEKAEYPRIWDCGKVRYCYVYKNERGRNEKYRR